MFAYFFYCDHILNTVSFLFWTIWPQKNKRDLTSKIFSAGLALLFVLAFPIYRPTNGELPTHVTQVDFVVQNYALERYVPSRMIYHVH